MNNINNITIFDGTSNINYEVIDVFNSNGINYIVFTDDNNIYASRYTVKNGNFSFQDIENDFEWQMIEKRINGLAYYG